MERLTDNTDYCKKSCGYEMPEVNCVVFECYDRKIYNKLREYEDAEEQGLLLRLPCKVGDTVYVLVDTLRKRKGYGAFDEKKVFFEEDSIPKYVECKVVGISLKNKGNYIKVRYTGEFEEKYFDYETGYDYQIITDYIDNNYVFSSIRKSVFLTKEEAEAALAEMKGEEK